MSANDVDDGDDDEDDDDVNNNNHSNATTWTNVAQPSRCSVSQSGWSLVDILVTIMMRRQWSKSVATTCNCYVDYLF